jgi:hypothetical protein
MKANPNPKHVAQKKMQEFLNQIRMRLAAPSLSVLLHIETKKQINIKYVSHILREFRPGTPSFVFQLLRDSKSDIKYIAQEFRRVLLQQ